MNRTKNRANNPSASPITAIFAVIIASAALAGCGPVYVQGADDGYYAQQQGYTAPAATDQWAYLAAHGTWVDNSRWGRVWVPSANATPGWRPYYYGHWDNTEYGWTWVSDEDWGWGPYHYGRWGWDATYSWVWVPGYTWGPAWVTWRHGGEHVGWAPLGPSGFVYTHHTYWTFIPQTHVYRHRVSTIVIAPTRVATIYTNSTHIGRSVRIRNHRGGVTTYNAGPTSENVTRWTNRPVPTTRVANIPSAVPRTHSRTNVPTRGAVSTRPPTYVGAPNGRVAPTYQPSAGARPAPTYSGGTATPPARSGGSGSPGTPGYAPTYRASPNAGGGQQPYRPAPDYRPAPTYRGAPTAPTYTAPGARAAPPTYRPAPNYTRPPVSSRPSPSPQPSRYVPPRPATNPAARPAPPPTYRPAPPRVAPSRGHAAPRADSRSNPNAVAPRGSSRSSGSASSSKSRRKSNERSSGRATSRRGTRDR